MDGSDGIKVCEKCGEYTTGRLCRSCQEQEMIDNDDSDLYDGDFVADFNCPKCESGNVIWIGGDNVVNVNGLLFTRVDFYRCNDCGHKFSY